MKKMCVFMMCGGRGSEHIIGKTLDSLKPMMNYLVFQDNGIKDNSGKIVKEWCINNDMKLHYYEVEWKNPGWNREHSYNVAVSLYDEHKSDWLFRMDADEYIDFIADDFEVESESDILAASYTNGNFRFTRDTFFNTHHDLVWEDQESHEISKKGDGSRLIGGNVSQDKLLIYVPPKEDVGQETPLELHYRFYRESMELEKKVFIKDNREEYSHKDRYNLYYAGKNIYDSCYNGDMAIWEDVDFRYQVISRGMWYFEKWLKIFNTWLTDMDNIKVEVESLRNNVDNLGYVYDASYYAYWCLGNMNQFRGKTFSESLFYFYAGNKLNPDRNEILNEMLNHYIHIEDWNSAYNICLQMNDKLNPSRWYGNFVMDNAYQDTSGDLQEKINEVLNEKR